MCCLSKITVIVSFLLYFGCYFDYSFDSFLGVLKVEFLCISVFATSGLCNWRVLCLKVGVGKME